MGKTAVPADVRFREKVNKTEGCWLWTAGVNRQGYGLFNRATKPSKCVLAHRYSYELAHGPLAQSACVLHRCDNPRCVRPDHLFLGTRTDNADDKVAKGRQRGPKGERHPKAKVTEAVVRSIRRDFAAGGVSKSELARRYKLANRTAHAIISGETWAHIEGGSHDD